MKSTPGNGAPLTGDSARLSWIAAASSASSVPPAPASSAASALSQSASLRPPCVQVMKVNYLIPALLVPLAGYVPARVTRCLLA